MKEPREIYVKKYCGPCPHNGDWVTAWETVKANEAEIESLKAELRDIGGQDREIINNLMADNERLKAELEEMKAWKDSERVAATKNAVDFLNMASRAQQAESKLADCEQERDRLREALESFRQHWAACGYDDIVAAIDVVLRRLTHKSRGGDS